MRKGNHGNQWKIAHTNIRPRPGRQIVFEGVRGLSFSGDIAIDDIVLLEGYCPPPGIILIKLYYINFLFFYVFVKFILFTFSIDVSLLYD